MKLEEWKEKNKGIRKYAHFDNRVGIEQCFKYISNPKNIIKHNFYPFIYYDMKFNKYNREKGVKIKIRPICYSAHIDRCIFQYYSFLLNCRYNRRAISDGINEVAIAYRDNLHKNNLHFAKEVIDFIREKKESYIIIGDFTGFFDNLDHTYLKMRISNLLGTGKLPKDYYCIYKNLTKFVTWDLKNLLELNNLSDSLEEIKLFNLKDRVLDINEFHKLKKEQIKINNNSYGIPQGSAISAVLSNVYMLEFDKEINEFTKSFNGMYRRYCDDFIIVVPVADRDYFNTCFNKINNIMKSVPNLVLQPEKTQIFKYDNKRIINCTSSITPYIGKNKNELEYLGLTFDGVNVRLRDKTITKYYYRVYRKIKTVTKCDRISPKGKRISLKNIYEKYSYKGSKPKNKYKRGNFISYVERAQRIFVNDSRVGIVKRRHMKKIKDRLNNVKNKNIDQSMSDK